LTCNPPRVAHYVSDSSRARPRAVVEDVIHRVAEPALALRFGPDPAARSELPGAAAAPDRADLLKAGALEERVRAAHRGERLDPIHRALLARTTHEPCCDPGAAISGMQHHALEEPQLLVERGQRDRRSRVAESEELRPQ